MRYRNAIDELTEYAGSGKDVIVRLLSALDPKKLETDDATFEQMCMVNITADRERPLGGG
ncbi:uncharacterized protein N0V89_012102 [Didymosphaeria variabile]|uniref:Uncharacterized protein n=1 Tax=Didymosphaeria variabile TaxID=1932322 RepID=A0A9W8X9U0_9PLEO|nr:uncharacterized protein N0V89_012102 [Didymosphaeria variabile]KAJ4344362.1 hypothetical protein N0V89_012102 [Didymosphaeria variabile]